MLTEPDDTISSIVTQLAPGRDWTIHHRIAGPNYLTIELLVSDPAELVDLYGINVNWTTSWGYVARRSVGPISASALRFDVEGIDADSVQVEVCDSHYVPRAGATGTFSGGRLHLTIPLTDKPFLLDVVDPDGEPIGDVYVSVSDPSGPDCFTLASTNSNGRCELKGLPQAQVLINLRHGTRRTHLGIPVDTTEGKHTLVLDDRSRIELQFEDGRVPLAGIACSLLDPGLHVSVVEKHADDAGRLSFHELGEGSYRLSASRSDCWNVELDAHAQPEP